MTRTFGDSYLGGTFGDPGGTFGDVGAGVTGYPTVQFQIAFDSEPLAETPSWTDVTEYVLVDPAPRTSLWRDTEFGQYGPLTFGWSLLNNDRRFDPLNTSGPYYGKLTPNRRARIVATYPAEVEVEAFAYTGAEQTFEVPVGVNWLTVDVVGASGGGTGAGDGGRVQARIPVDPGETLYIYVGGVGGASGGFNGGGDENGTTRGGGGASDIRRGGNGTANRVVVAGGGGGQGGSTSETGGDGGATAGSGTAGSGGGGGGAAVGVPGVGGTASGSGAAGESGTLAGTGGDGGTGTSSVRHGGGAGGGLHGGGGGGGSSTGNGGGGGGGVSWAAPDCEDVTYTDGYRTGAGSVQISYQIVETIADGFVDSWPQDYELGGRYVTELSATGITKMIAGRGLRPYSPWVIGGENSARLNAGNLLAGNPSWPRERAGARAARVLDALGITATFRDLDDGQSEMLADSPDQTTDALGYLQGVVDSELGRLYTTADGKLRFEERRSWTRQHRQRTSVVTLTDDTASDFRYSAVAFDPQSDVDVRSVVSRTNTNDVTARKVTDDVRDEIGWMEDALGGVLVPDESLQGMVTYLATLRATPPLRATVTIPAARLDLRESLFPLVLGLRIGDRVTLECTPRGTGSTISAEMWVEGIAHEFTQHDWQTTLRLVAADSYTYWTLNDATLGVLSAGNVLAY